MYRITINHARANKMYRSRRWRTHSSGKDVRPISNMLRLAGNFRPCVYHQRASTITKVRGERNPNAARAGT